MAKSIISPVVDSFTEELKQGEQERSIAEQNTLLGCKDGVDVTHSGSYYMIKFMPEANYEFIKKDIRGFGTYDQTLQAWRYEANNENQHHEFKIRIAGMREKVIDRNIEKEDLQKKFSIDGQSAFVPALADKFLKRAVESSSSDTVKISNTGKIVHASPFFIVQESGLVSGVQIYKWLDTEKALLQKYKSSTGSELGKPTINGKITAPDKDFKEHIQKLFPLGESKYIAVSFTKRPLTLKQIEKGVTVNPNFISSEVGVDRRKQKEISQKEQERELW